MEVHPKVWGEEHWIVNNEKYCGKKMLLRKGFQCSLHYHKLKHETFYVQSGRVLMIMGHDDNQGIRELLPGDTVTIAPYVKHSFRGIEDSEIFEFSTQHFEDDSYRLTKSGPVAADR